MAQHDELPVHFCGLQSWQALMHFQGVVCNWMNMSGLLDGNLPFLLEEKKTIIFKSWELCFAAANILILIFLFFFICLNIQQLENISEF